MIVLEGSDGSGKSTQFNLLSERLKAAGYEVETFDFPQYSQDSSYFVKQYLSGAFGSATKMSPYTASLFYALDRFAASKAINEALDAGKIVLADRFTGANMAYQGSKFTDSVEQRGFFVWADNLEFQLLNIPRPDVNFFLRVPAEISANLLKERSAASGVALDEHEKDISFLRKSLSTYDLLCQLFPKDFTAIECTKDGELLSVPEISNLIWEKVKPLLPPEPPHNGHPAVVSLDRTLANQSSHGPAEGNKLIHDFKKSSLLLKLAVERQLKAIEPSGFTIWADNSYAFYTPMGLPKDIEAEYKRIMGRLGQLNEEMRRKLGAYYEQKMLSGEKLPNISSLLLPVTPMAAICDFRVSLSPQAVNRVAGNLLAADSHELQWAAKQLYTAARQAWPEDFKQPLESAGNPEPLNNIIAQLAEEKLSFNSGDREDVKLLEAAPRLEFDLLSESIYPYSSLSLDEISEEVSGWSYHQKFESLKAAAQDEAVLGRIRYKFDVISDQLTLAEAVGAAMLKDVQVQSPSPRLGYDVPSVIEDAGVDELYLECFDESLKLFSALQQADRDDLTVYASLLGHKLRWQFQADAKALRELISRAGSEAFTRLTAQIREAAAEAHPLTWDVLTDFKQDAPVPTSSKNRANRVKPARRRKRGSKPKKT